MDKLYQRINYENSPSKKTPLSEANLNKMDKALDDLDNRIIEQDAAFAKSIEEEGKKIEEVNGKVSDLTGTATTLTQSKADAIVCTASGERITATDSADAGFEQFKLFGKSVQDKTPGNQLAEKVIVSQSSNNLNQYSSVLWIEADLKPETTYTISFEGTVGNSLYINENITAYKQFKVVSGITTLTFTTVSNMDKANTNKYDSSNGWIIFKNDAAQTTANVFNNVMLVEGSTALPWEPYTGGIASPNPEYPQPIVSAGQKLENGIVSDVGISKKLTGKNLLKNTATSKTVNGVTFTVNEDGSVTCNGTATADAYIDISVDLLPNTEYILSGCPAGGSSTNYSIYVIDYEIYKVWGRDVGVSVKFTTESITRMRARVIVKNGITVSNLTFKPMIRYADIEDDTYEPYTEQTLTLNRVLRGIPVTLASLANYTDESGQMWCADEIDVERGVLVQRCHYADIELSNFTKITNTNTTLYRLSTSDKYAGIAGHAEAKGSYCSISNTYAYDSGDYAHWYIDQSLMIRVDNQFASVVDALDYISVCYILATPIETTLTDEEIAAYKALHSNKPTTVITNDAGCYMEVEYVADTKNHIAQNYVPVTAFNDVLDRISALEQLHV